MTSQTTFFKIPLQVDYINANTDAGDLIDSYTDITRRRRNRNRASLRTWWKIIDNICDMTKKCFNKSYLNSHLFKASFSTKFGDVVLEYINKLKTSYF